MVTAGEAVILFGPSLLALAVAASFPTTTVGNQESGEALEAVSPPNMVAAEGPS